MTNATLAVTKVLEDQKVATGAYQVLANLIAPNLLPEIGDSCIEVQIEELINLVGGEENMAGVIDPESLRNQIRTANTRLYRALSTRFGAGHFGYDRIYDLAELLVEGGELSKQDHADLRFMLGFAHKHIDRLKTALRPIFLEIDSQTAMANHVLESVQHKMPVIYGQEPVKIKPLYTDTRIDYTYRTYLKSDNHCHKAYMKLQ